MQIILGHILVPLKGTKMFEMVENEGLLNEDMIISIRRLLGKLER